VTHLRSTTFAVVDVETTGIYPTSDRLTEIAIVNLRLDGTVVRSFETLINPDRDLGPVRIHGIRGADVANAPRFHEIAANVLEHLSGSIVVAHNARFDLSFLRQEFARVGYELSDVPFVCTLQMATRQQVGARRLRECCERVGVSCNADHSAAQDARAAAALFLALIEKGGYTKLEELGCRGDPCRFNGSVSQAVAHTRSDALILRREERTYLSKLVRQLPTVGAAAEDIDTQCYMDLLDRCLEDGTLEQSESQALVRFAAEFCMTQSGINNVHAKYFESVVSVAAADGVVTDEEYVVLCHVAELLGLSTSIVPRGLVQPTPSESCTEDLCGKTVCFTGETQFQGSVISRTEAEMMARGAGLVVLPRVTKTLDILVVADPSSLSGKAKKARQYGTRIMADFVFWRKLGLAARAAKSVS
jgi:DNA polymerase III subunit epsilon